MAALLLPFLASHRAFPPPGEPDNSECPRARQNFLSPLLPVLSSWHLSSSVLGNDGTRPASRTGSQIFSPLFIHMVSMDVAKKQTEV